MNNQMIVVKRGRIKVSAVFVFAEFDDHVVYSFVDRVILKQKRVIKKGCSKVDKIRST